MFNNILRIFGNKTFNVKTADARPVASVQDFSKKELKEILAQLDTSIQGLSEEEVQARLEKNGTNEVIYGKKSSALIQLLHAYANPFVGVLLVLATISYFTDVYFAAPGEKNWGSIIVMLTMVLISGFLRFIQEYRSSKAAEKLKSMVVSTATVVRSENGQVKIYECPMSHLVVGDVIQLQAGDMVPADVRLAESRDLFISQAALTGESLPVEKYDTTVQITTPPVNTASANKASKTKNLIDLDNICFMGTNVISGRARAIVVATGKNTYFGSLAQNVVTDTRVQTSFDKGVNSISWLLIRFMMVMVPVVFLINGFTKGDWITAFSFALAVAVGLTPEMLPMIVSANLAKGAVSMARRKVVVKRINAVQNLGAMDVLCTDKTGTLTQDEIILEHYLNLHNEEDQHILELAWLNSAYQSGQRNLMDIAVVTRVKKMEYPLSTNDQTKVDELPFDFIRRRLSVILKKDDHTHQLIAKGAVEEMLAVCTSYQQDGQITPLDDKKRDEIIALTQQYNEDGFRVLLLATKDITDIKNQYEVKDENNLCVEGILTFLDPPKDSAYAAIQALKEYGVDVKVLTGDNAYVAAKVCRQVGLTVVTPVTGNDIDLMDDAALKQSVTENTLFAKLTPLQKARIVKALQAQGHTVGFLGDGINDAPALRDADVGISVDSGTDIAKETADIILLEKSLMILEEGVIKGRETFGNILKYLNATASANFGNVFSIMIASIWLPWEPMLAMQLLVQNLIYDISQMALPWDKMDEEFLKKPRQWHAGHIGRFMIWFGPTSSIFDVTTFILLWFVFGAGAAYHQLGGDGGQSIMNTGWFIEGLISQTLVVHMLRTGKIPFIQSMAAFPIIASTIGVVILACFLPYSPIADALHFTQLPKSYFLWIILTMLVYMGFTQLIKFIYMRRYQVLY